MPTPIATAAPAAAPAAPTNGAAKGATQQPVAPRPPVGAKPVAAPEVDADPVIWEGKVNGQHQQVRKSQADRYLSKGANADAATQQAKEMIRRAQKAEQEFEAREQKRLEAAKSDTEAFLREHGIDPDEYARARLERRVAEGKMTPEERRASEAEARAKELEAKLAAQEQERETQQRTQQATQLERNIQTQLMAAVKRANLSTGPDTLHTLHATMSEMMELRLLPLDGNGLPAHVADQIVEESKAKIESAMSGLEKAVLSGLKGPALKARLGDVVYKEVLAHALEEVRARRPGYKPVTPGAPPPPAAPPPTRPNGYTKISDFDARVRDIAGKHTS